VIKLKEKIRVKDKSHCRYEKVRTLYQFYEVYKTKKDRDVGSGLPLKIKTDFSVIFN